METQMMKVLLKSKVQQAYMSFPALVLDDKPLPDRPAASSAKALHVIFIRFYLFANLIPNSQV